MVTKPPTKRVPGPSPGFVLPPAAAARPRPATPRPDPWALRPMVRVQRITLFEREVRERLSPSALDLILARAEVISEGQRETRAGKPIYLGSTMLTINLQALSPLLRDSCDAGCAQRLAAQLQADGVATARVKAIAAREIERLAAARPKGISAEMKVRSQGARVFVDIDVEATF